MMLFSLAILTMMSFVSSENDPLRVQSNSGSIKGFYGTSFHGRKYRAFLGIPYAKPPVGKLRFQPPEPVSPWEYEINATSIPEMCIQVKSSIENANVTFGSEDCLYLNIFAPLLGTSSASLPVIFHIVGGLFFFGSSADYGPGYLLDREVIVITFNYRLGPLGWLSTEDDVVPGNMGLKDQSTALRWVSENIKAFGGDPNKIMIAGHSSGAINAHDHSLSSWSKGLFQRGIMMSGTALNGGSLVQRPLEKAQKVAALVGCSIVNTTIMVDCLMSANATDIVLTSHPMESIIFGSIEDKANLHGPVVEKGGRNPFLNAAPKEIISRGEAMDVPWITGVVDGEGVMITMSYSSDEKVMTKVNNEWNTMAPYVLGFTNTIPKNNQSHVAGLIKKHYFGSSAITITNVDTYVAMVGDGMFKADTAGAARILANGRKSPVYFYYFSYRGARSVTDSVTKSHDNFGVAHGDDLAYIFEHAEVNTSTTAEDIAMRELLLDYWVSYATNGSLNVGIEWPQINSSMQELQYLHIMGPHKVTVETSTDFAEEKFWRTIRRYENIHEISHSQGAIVDNSVLLVTICQILFLTRSLFV